MQRTGITSRLAVAFLAAVALALAGCATSGGGMAKSGMAPAMAMDPMKSEHAAIDRFGAAAHLQMRDAMNHLPGAEPAGRLRQAAVRHDRPGTARGDGHVLQFRCPVHDTLRRSTSCTARGRCEPVAGQLNIVDVVPGEMGYNDFWRVNKVTVPSDYVANSVGSLQAIKDAGVRDRTDRHSRELPHRARRLNSDPSAERKRHGAAHPAGIATRS